MLTLSKDLSNNPRVCRYIYIYINLYFFFFLYSSSYFQWTSPDFRFEACRE